MKKNLIILGLLLCTTGFAFADENTQLADTTIQQTEVQSQIDKNTFKNFDNQRKFNREVNGQNKPEKIKYDKSVNTQKYKNFETPKGYNGKYKSEYRGKYSAPHKNGYHRARPDIKADRKPDIFKPERRPAPRGYVGKYSHKYIHKPYKTTHKVRRQYKRA